MGDAYRGQAQLRAEVQRQPGGSRVVPGRGVEQEQVRSCCQLPDGLVEETTDPQGQEARTVRRPCDAGADPLLDYVATVHDHHRSPGRIARVARSAQAMREARPAPADPQLSAARLPRLGPGSGQVPLSSDQRLGVVRPHVTILARTASAYIGGVGAGGHVLCLTGDVMTGRGVDQILPGAGDPRLWERGTVSSRSYVELAEAESGPIPQPVDFSWPWGDALSVLDEMAPDLRIVNLETSVTRSDDHQAGKAVLYRMSPGNVDCLTAARLDACALANNHVLDFGVGGLEETLDVLTRAGLGPVGAGRDEEQAWRPRVLTAGGHRVLLWSVAAASSGVPGTWAARPDRAGVAFVRDLSEADADALGERVRRVRQPGDITVVSVHWGSNWGYAVPRQQVSFAHRLVDSGVDVVHGHSSHHPRPVEVYRGRLVLYGCGDLINDYEGIAGEEQFRGDLRLLYVARLDPTGRLDELRMVPMQSRQMSLRRAQEGDASWLQRVLHRISRPFGSRVDLAPDGSLLLRPEGTR